MACSFRYFLLKRCQGLTGLNTTSTKKFFAAAEDAHPEAFAPLLLLAICDGREEYLLRRAEGTKAAEMFDEFVEHWHASGRPLEVYLGMLPTATRSKPSSSNGAPTPRASRSTAKS